MGMNTRRDVVVVVIFQDQGNVLVRIMTCCGRRDV
jgi:hypothetical protein